MRTYRMMTLAVSVILTAGTVAAQATRTWISGVGDDVNPCSRTAPCKTFAGAISKTAPAGEINALDPGGFGAVTITKSMTLDGGGQVAGVLVSGTNGIIVAAGPTDTVIIRNLDINGLGTGLNGIDFLSGKRLIIENCNIYGFITRNVSIESSTANSYVTISNSTIHDGSNNGIVVQPSIGPVSVVLEHVRSVHNNNIGLVVSNGTVQAFNSVFSNNTNAGVEAHAGGTVDVVSSLLSTNGNGIESTAGSPIVRISNTAIVDNTNSGFNMGSPSAQIHSFGNNQFAGNALPNIGTLVPISEQ